MSGGGLVLGAPQLCPGGAGEALDGEEVAEWIATLMKTGQVCFDPPSVDCGRAGVNGWGVNSIHVEVPPSGAGIRATSHGAPSGSPPSQSGSQALRG